MKIEFMNTPTNGRLLRLFDFSNDEVLELKNLVEELGQGTIKSIAVHEHANIDPEDNCHLTMKLGKEDRGITQPREGEYVCELSKFGFQNMVQLLESFALHPVEHEGYQWLDESGEVSLLIAPSKRF